MKKDITELFCFVDDFYQSIVKEFEKSSISDLNSIKTMTRIPGLTESEIMTIALMFHGSPCRNFKYFYNSYLQYYRSEFQQADLRLPKMPSYERFIALMPRILYLLAILLCCLFRKGSKLAYIDSTAIPVCHVKRSSRNKVFKGIATKGKSTKGWFFGFKLHLIIDDKGNLMKAKLTAGNVDDRAVVDHITSRIDGLIFGDKGYISKDLFLRLLARGLKLITGIKSNMKNIIMSWNEKILLRKRSLVETVIDYLKNKLMLEHSRHRSIINFFIHIVATLITYQLKPTKPHILTNYALT